MAHEMEIINGQASFVTVGKRPWWEREATYITRATPPSLEEAIRDARLDYPLEKRAVPITVIEPDGSEGQVSSRALFYIYRPDRQLELGSVGRTYHIVSNTDAFRATGIEILLDKNLATIETAGVLRNGADAWLLLKWNINEFAEKARELFLADTLGLGGVQPYALLMLNHTGKRGIIGRDVWTRVECSNTAEMALGETVAEFRVEHHAKALSELADKALAYWHGKVALAEKAADAFKALKARIVTEEEFAAAIEDVIAPDPRRHAKWNPEAKMAALVVSRYEKKVATLRRLWDSGIGHTGDHSAWEAMNAVTQAMDHNEDGLWPTRGGVYRTASLLTGNLYTMKQQVIHNLSLLAGIQLQGGALDRAV